MIEQHPLPTRKELGLPRYRFALKTNDQRLPELGINDADNFHAEVLSLSYEEAAKRIMVFPELLKSLLSFPGFTDDAVIGDAWVEKMRAAIAKATEE